MPWPETISYWAEGKCQPQRWLPLPASGSLVTLLVTVTVTLIIWPALGFPDHDIVNVDILTSHTHVVVSWVHLSSLRKNFTASVRFCTAGFGPRVKTCSPYILMKFQFHLFTLLGYLSYSLHLHRKTLIHESHGYVFSSIVYASASLRFITTPFFSSWSENIAGPLLSTVSAPSISVSEWISSEWEDHPRRGAEFGIMMCWLRPGQLGSLSTLLARPQ